MSLDELHELGWIDKTLPFWWNIDFPPDPREVVSLETFVERKMTVPWKGYTEKSDIVTTQRDIYIAEKVPILIYEKEINGAPIKLFITARPWNKSELERGDMLIEKPQEISEAQFKEGLENSDKNDPFKIGIIFEEGWGPKAIGPLMRFVLKSLNKKRTDEGVKELLMDYYRGPLGELKFLKIIKNSYPERYERLIKQKTKEINLKERMEPVYFPPEELMKNSERNPAWLCYTHFFSHVRGIVKEIKNNTLFWHPILSYDAVGPIKEALIKDFPNMGVWLHFPEAPRIYYLFAYHPYGKLGIESTSNQSPYKPSYDELKKKHLISWRKGPDIFNVGGFKRVAYDAFVNGSKEKDWMISFYPLRHPEINDTFTVVLSTESYPEDKKSIPSVLGALSRKSWKEDLGIWRFRDKKFAKDLSGIISKELEIDFNVVYFDGTKYEKVSYKD